MSNSRAIAYVGAGAAVGGGFSALRGGMHGRVIALGAATGAASAGVQTAVEAKTGSSVLGWGAAIGGGAFAGALLLRGLAPPTFTPIAQRGVGAAIGAVTGLLAPIAAGMVLAQLAPG